MNKRRGLEFLGVVAYWYYLFFLWIVKRLGFRLVWTAHNVLPHEQAFPDDVAARKKLAAWADLVIVHSASTVEELKKIGVILKRVVVIPHGSYVGVYPNIIKRAEARNKLGIAENVFVYLYLGLVRPYKGTEELLAAYGEIQNANNELIIAGKCQDENLKKILRGVSGSGNIMWHDKYINDDDLQIYFAAADVVALPFKAITSSGSALLALSFGKAVIVPSLGDLANLPDSIVYKYSSEDKAGLKHAMEKAAKDPEELRKKSDMALTYSTELSWSSIAKQTHAALQSIS
jgi:beta-1,4-mannosyltransferase